MQIHKIILIATLIHLEIILSSSNNSSKDELLYQRLSGPFSQKSLTLPSPKYFSTPSLNCELLLNFCVTTSAQSFLLADRALGNIKLVPAVCKARALHAVLSFWFID